MRYFRHQRGKIVIEVIAAFLIGSGAGAGAIMSGRLSLVLSAPIVLLYGAFRAFTLLARDPALAFDQHGLQVGRLFRVSKFKWDQLRDVRVGRWRIDDSFGTFLPSWLPLEREYVELQLSGTTLDSTLLKLRSDLVELPPGGAPELVELVRAAQVAALGGRGAAMTRLGMDARQQAAAAPAPSGIHAERLQRLGLAEEPEAPLAEPLAAEAAPVPQAYVPQRPTFGRKVS